MMLQSGPKTEKIRFAREVFPGVISSFNRLFFQHGLEVRGRPFELDFKRYHQLEFEKRLIWIVARWAKSNAPLGYSCHYWYRDLHYNERVGADDLWFVDRRVRGMGIGADLKWIGHDELCKAGAIKTSDNIRGTFHHGTLMRDLGFEPWGIRWQKTDLNYRKNQ
jgi:hypothetical protein